MPALRWSSPECATSATDASRAGRRERPVPPAQSSRTVSGMMFTACLNGSV
jgi:hypothetical protein